jgi:hypothetical protein
MPETWQSDLQTLGKFFLDCLTLEDEIDRLTRNVSNYQSMPGDIPKGEDLKGVSVSSSQSVSKFVVKIYAEESNSSLSEKLSFETRLLLISTWRC